MLLIVAFGFIIAGLILHIGGWIWGFNTFAQLGSSGPTPAGDVQTGIGVALVSWLIGTPMLLIGAVLLVVSVIVHFATRPKGENVS